MKDKNYLIDKKEKIKEYLCKKALMQLDNEVFAVNTNAKSKFYGMICLVFLSGSYDKYYVPKITECIGLPPSERFNIKDYDFYGNNKYISYYRDYIISHFLLTKSFLFESIKEIEIGDGVKVIANYAFYECKSLKAVNLTGSVKFLGTFAFGCCTELMEFNFNKLENCIIKNKSFFGCESLTEADLSGVNEIGESCFESCINLKTVKLSECLKNIPEYCFYRTNIESLYIPDSVIDIGYWALCLAKNLTKIKIGKENIANSNIDLFFKEAIGTNEKIIYKEYENGVQVYTKIYA